jgi:5-methylcytosine-specific restriction endonuclease McrA
MNARTLVLTPWYLPYRVVCWEDAITLLYLDKVEVVVSYAQKVRSPSVTLALPAVIRMKKRVSTHRYRIRFSRVNVFMRDEFRCMYCGKECAQRELTFDHVIPRSQGGRTEWANILSACNRCNTQKGNRTPAQAGMAPLRRPFKPDTLPMRPQRLDLGRIPEEWRDFCIGSEASWA